MSANQSEVASVGPHDLLFVASHHRPPHRVSNLRQLNDAQRFHGKIWKLLKSNPFEVLKPFGLGALMAIALQLLLRRIGGAGEQTLESNSAAVTVVAPSSTKPTKVSSEPKPGRGSRGGKKKSKKHAD